MTEVSNSVFFFFSLRFSHQVVLPLLKSIVNTAQTLSSTLVTIFFWAAIGAHKFILFFFFFFFGTAIPLVSLWCTLCLSFCAVALLICSRNCDLDIIVLTAPFTVMRRVVPCVYRRDKVQSALLPSPFKEKVYYCTGLCTTSPPPSGASTSFFGTYTIGVPLLSLVQAEHMKVHQAVLDPSEVSSFPSDCVCHSKFGISAGANHELSWATKYYYCSVLFFLATCGLMLMWFIDAFIDLSNGLYGLDGKDEE